MPRDLSQLLSDVATRSRRAQDYAQALTFDQYRDAIQLQDAVERNLLVVGEALSQALAYDRSLAWKISRIRQVIAFRHLLAHHYYKVSPRIVWGILETSLPQLDRENAQLRIQIAPSRSLSGTAE